MYNNSTEEENVIEFLTNPGPVAVIGASNKPHRAGHYVPKFLQSKGFQIIPINPYEVKILGEKTLENQEQLETEIKGMIIYREIHAAKNEALKAIEANRTPLIWFPDNVVSDKVGTVAKEHNVTFIQDRCPLRDYRYYIEND